MDSGPGTAYPAPDAVRLSRSRAIGSVSNGKCNSLWHEYKDACYYFGEHANYDEATYHCEKNGAERGLGQ